MRYPQDRSYYIPREEGVVEQRHDDVATVIYLWIGTRGHSLGKAYAMGFAGKAKKPTFHYHFRSVERRDEFIAAFLQRRREQAGRKADSKAKRLAFQHTLKVGDVLRSSWGYDQTNIDYYQVVALKGAKQVVCRQIAAVSETTGFDTGKCGPAVGNFLARYEPQTFLVQQGNRIRVASYACAYPVPCQKDPDLSAAPPKAWLEGENGTVDMHLSFSGR